MFLVSLISIPAINHHKSFIFQSKILYWLSFILWLCDTHCGYISYRSMSHWEIFASLSFSIFIFIFIPFLSLFNLYLYIFGIHVNTYLIVQWYTLINFGCSVYSYLIAQWYTSPLRWCWYSPSIHIVDNDKKQTNHH